MYDSGRSEIKIFLLTRPLRDVTHIPIHTNAGGGFLLTRPLRDVTYLLGKIILVVLISTHTPLTGRDGDYFRNVIFCEISTHTPLTGRDGENHIGSVSVDNFYSHAPYGT